LVVNFFFPRDYDEILFYTSYSHGQTKLFKGKCSENLNISSWREDQNLGFVDVGKNSIYEFSFIIKEVEQDQLLTKVEELEKKNLKKDRLSKMMFLKKFLKRLKKEICN
jgi:hypothetical protein